MSAWVSSRERERPVDAANGPFVPRLNEAHAQAQRELLRMVGMGEFAE